MKRFAPAEARRSPTVIAALDWIDASFVLAYESPRFICLEGGGCVF